MSALNRVAAVAAVLAGVGQIVATVSEPELPDDPPAAMTALAANSWFEPNRVLDLLTFLLAVFALAVFTRLVGQRGRPWAQTSLVFLAALGALGSGAVLTQVALRFIADSWMAAAPDSRSAQEVVFRAVNEISSNLYGGAFLTYGLFLGLAGAAVLAGRAQPRWIGWALSVAGLGLVAGTLGLVAYDNAFLVVLAALGLVDVLLVVIGLAEWRGLDQPRARVDDAQRLEGVGP